MLGRQAGCLRGFTSGKVCPQADIRLLMLQVEAYRGSVCFVSSWDETREGGVRIAGFVFLQWAAAWAACQEHPSSLATHRPATGMGCQEDTTRVVVLGIFILSLRAENSIQVLTLESCFFLLFSRNQRDPVKSCWKASAFLASRLSRCCRAPGSGLVGYLQTVWFLKIM